MTLRKQIQQFQVIHLISFSQQQLQNIASKVVPTNKNYTDYLTNPFKKTFFLRPTAPDEIENVIKTLNVGKSLGPISTPTKLLTVFQISHYSSVKSNHLQSSKSNYVQCNIYRSLSLQTKVN